MNRQERRGMADMRHRDRKKRLQQLVATRMKKISTNSNEDEPAVRATVISSGRGLCSVADESGERMVRCDLRVAPGDEVSIRHEKIAAIATRRTKLARTDPGNPNRELLIAANVDLLLIVAPMIDPPFRQGLIDRYLIAAHRGGIGPVLCINKIDLCSDTAAAEVFRIPIIRCSAATGQGISELLEIMAGNLAVLAGHSGTGKSTLLNALTKVAQARTGAVSSTTGKGRQTTTSSRLYTLQNGGRIIDTPGIRELGLGAISRSELIAAFPEFGSENCRFAGCLHRTEPGCEIRQAGGVRYEAWLRLTGELG
jgi:ribosome biogenesis GTPase